MSSRDLVRLTIFIIFATISLISMILMLIEIIKPYIRMRKRMKPGHHKYDTPFEDRLHEYFPNEWRSLQRKEAKRNDKIC